MSNQAARKVLMVRPCCFGFNAQTAGDNAMQSRINDLTSAQIQTQAQQEFDAMVKMLRDQGVEVLVVQDEQEAEPTPDSIFPNNWFSTHPEGNKLLPAPHLCLYPMCAPNRRRERAPSVLQALAEQCGLSEINDMSHPESENRFLEGTGSLVLDHVAKIAYMARSPRSDEGLCRQWCELYGYEPVIFDAVDSNGTPIYHTNVLMSVGSNFAIVCLDVIAQKSLVTDSLKRSGKTVVVVSEDQIRKFAANALEVQGKEGKHFLVMSITGWQALSQEQRQTLQDYCEPITPNVKTIETIGGGSCRCMLAEIFA